MNFPFYCSKVITTDQSGFAILEASKFDRNSKSKEYIAEILDKMGEASSIAQGLRAVITTYSKFVSSSDNKIYMKIENNKVCGILKTGKKNLFYYDGFGKVRELQPLCVLDFYVHESVQRLGVGKFLFEKMLENEKIKPNKLAYDRPSPKLLAFLRKHYDLGSYIPQNNNFVIYNAFWDDSYNIPKNSQKPSADQSLNNILNSKPLSRERITPENKTYSTDFHKVGRSILASNANNLVLSQNERIPEPTKQVSNSYTTNFYARSGQNMAEPPKNQYLIGSGRYEPQQQQHLGYQGGMNKAQLNGYIPMNNYQQQPSTYETPKYPYSRAPWGSYGGANLDSFKSSLAYGNYYNQAGNDFAQGRRK